MAKKTVVIEPLNLDSVLGSVWNRVQKVGVELEGGWSKQLVLPRGCKFVIDASVFKEADGSSMKNHPKYAYLVARGELPIPPMVPGQLSTTIKKLYPDLIDFTCGLHVHMSFKTIMEYNLLADTPVYQETLLHYLLKWAQAEKFPDSHHIWNRLKGKNKFCLKEFWPNSQMVKTEKEYTREGDHRYTAVSYQWTRYQTVECRVLPMMDTPAQAVRAIKEVIKITNAYLVKTDKTRIKGGGKIELPNGEIYEQTLESRI